MSDEHEYDDVPEDIANHLKNIMSLSKEYGQPIDGPDVPDMLDIVNMTIRVFDALIVMGEEVMQFSTPEEFQFIAKSLNGLAYNMGKKRGQKEARYQIERAVAQLDPPNPLDLMEQVDAALSVKTQLRQYLDSLED